VEVYLDTEFTDLDEPNLLSIGLVSARGDEFYAELDLELGDTRDRMRVVSEFVLHGPVLTQWGLVAGAGCSHLELGRRAGAWLRDRSAVDGGVEVLSDCRLDYELLAGALSHAGVLESLRAAITNRTIGSVVESPSGQRAQAAAFELISRERGLLQHHALADAIALRAVHLSTRTSIELLAMRARLGMTDQFANEATQHQATNSESAKASWVRDGLLVGSEQLAEAWSCSLQTLEQARVRGHLCSMQFQGHHWYPSVLTSVSPADVGQVSAALQGLDAVSQFIFWNQLHGSMGGVTAAEAIAAGKLVDVQRLAQAFASER